MGRFWQRIREGIRRFLYWLGPMYCVLLGATILLASFIVQMLTSIGVPFLKFLDFFRFDMYGGSFIELGIWAPCQGRKAVYIPTQPSIQPTEEFNCSPPKWGWKTTQFSGITDNFFHHDLPKALIFHPISCGFTFLAMMTALVTLKRKRQHFLLPIFSILSCLFALISFFIDVGTFVPAKGKLMSPKAVSILGATVTSTSLGPAFWLSLVAFVLDVTGNFTIIAGYAIWRYQRISHSQRRLSGQFSQDIELKAGARTTRRGHLAHDDDDVDEDHSPFTEKATTPAAASSSSGSGTAVLSRRGHTDAKSVHSQVESLVDAPAARGSDELSDTARTAEDFGAHTDEEDGYDSAVSAYADARSEAGRSSFTGRSRSNVAVNETSPTMPSSPSRTVKRKPVERYE